MLITCSSALGATFLHSLLLVHRTAENLPALGRSVAGPWAGKVGGFVQSLNFVLYLPVALLVCAQSLQNTISPSLENLPCTDYWIFIVASMCLATTQLRSLANATVLSLISLIAVLATLLVVCYVISQTPNASKTPAIRFGNPSLTFSSLDSASLQSWTTFALGLSMASWAYAPAFLTAELSNSATMYNVRDFPKAIWFSAILTCAMYVLVGRYVVEKWGWNVNDPMFLGTADDFELWPAADMRSRLANFFWFVSCIISYALDSVPLARTCQRAWAPDFDLDDWSLKGCATYLLITLPTFVFAVTLSVFVPSLFCMLAIATALTVPWANQVYPAWLYWKASSGVVSAVGESGEPLLPPTTTREIVVHDEWMERCRVEKKGWRVLLVGGMGLLMFVVCAGGAVGKLYFEDLRGPTTVGCDGWIILK